MKRRLFLALSLLVSIMTTSAQEYYEVNTAPDVRNQAYRPNQVIVKFKTDGAVSVRKNAQGRFKTAGVSSVDQVLQKHGVEEAEQLMPRTGKLAANAPRRVKGYNGKEFELKDLSKLYCLKLSENSESSNLFSLIEELKALPDVEFAEPNYLVYACAAPEDWTSDPLYSQQWGIPAINLPQLWQKPVITDKRPVIAILDTGVEIAHPDLAANIWTNTAEAEGSSKYDDDNNGFQDDLHGWDFVNQTGYIDDYNGHGTHCAGIAAATGGNGLGIVGANPNALIMPVTVMQSDGTGDIATIIRGIDYAAANGADVISMSFGGRAYSIAEEQALARAYATAVLVAAAGNDGHAITPGAHCKFSDGPNFPAAFTFVLGVQATMPNGTLASFSSFDNDGPIYSAFSEEQLYNYELKAPGTTVTSTFSNGSYKALNGTSMACPLVAGAISRLLQTKEYATKELLFGDLIHAANGGNVDMLATYDITDADRRPNLSLVSWRIEDEKDNDGRFDAGEHIKFYPMLRNDWGTAENIQVWMEMGDQESHSVLSFSNAMVSSAKPLSSYAKAEMETPIEFTISNDVVDGRHIRLVLYAQCDGMDAPSAQEIVITAENGVEIGGMIDHDMTLEAGVNYIVTSNFAVPAGVTLTIQPGCVIKFKDKTSFSVAGSLICDGTPGNMITFTKADLDMGQIGYISFGGNEVSYVRFVGISKYSGNSQNQLIFGDLTNCIVEDVNGSAWTFDSGVLETCNLTNSNYRSTLGYDTKFVSSNIINNRYSYCDLTKSSFSNYSLFNGSSNIISNRLSNGNVFAIGFDGGVNLIQTTNPAYYGSSLEGKIRNYVYDMKSGYGFLQFDLSNMLTQPNPDAHGIVWKVLVNGYDAQDEFDQLPALGVGRHKFEVWYSKKVDETEAPMIAMGVRSPYTQTAIAEDGSWRTETVRFLRNGNVEPTEIKNVVNGAMNNGSSYWAGKYSSGGYSTFSKRTGFDGACTCVHGSSYKPFIGKFYQNLGAVPNGVYKFLFKVQPEGMVLNNAQYIYANGDKTYLDSTEPKVYEVITTVTNNHLEVGFEQTEDAEATNASSGNFGYIYLDDANLEMIGEPQPYGYDLDVSVYTAYLTIKGGMAIDGLNRIYVNGGRDLEYFDIPREDSRFNVEVAAAGSMSFGFMGEAGIGKVTLTWENQDENVDDILGYNLYRYTGDDETAAVKINQRLLDATEYVDYDVVPGTTYSYFYKIMRTDLAENSPSKTVAVTPVTASKGDANGSMTVDVADVVTEVNYLTGQNPQPFIFEAADVNSDEAINILDIVGTINIIVNPAQSGIANIGQAVYTIEDGVLYVESDVALGGVQISLKDSKDFKDSKDPNDPKDYKVLNALKDFEIVNTDGLFLAYSMSGKTLAPGKHALLQLGTAEVEDIVLSDALGHNVEVVAGAATAVVAVKGDKTSIGVPHGTTIPYYIYEAGRHSVRIEIYDVLGHIQQVWNGTADSGKHSYTWNADRNQTGVYFAVLKVDGKMVGTAKLVKQ